MSVRVRVLVVEDDGDVRESLKELIEVAEHDVDVAADGLEGLRLAQSGHYDAVILDLNLPGMDGLEVGRILAQQPNRPYLIAHTAFARPDDRSRTANAGFDLHLAKGSDQSLGLLEEVLASLRERAK